MNPLQGVILDVDGTLVDSNDAHASAWIVSLAEHGFDVPFAKVRSLIGMGSDQLLPRACGVPTNSLEGQKIVRRRGELFRERYLSAVHAFPGAASLMRHMRQYGLRLAVASSAQEDELAALLRICGANEVIETRTSADNVERSKPDPDVIHAALTELKLPPTAVIMLGDTPYDIAAATKASVPIIAFRCGGWNDTDLAGASTIYDGPADLLAHYASSPLANVPPQWMVPPKHIVERAAEQASPSIVI